LIFFFFAIRQMTDFNKLLQEAQEQKRRFKQRVELPGIEIKPQKLFNKVNQ